MINKQTGEIYKLIIRELIKFMNQPPDNYMAMICNQ